MTEPAAPVRRHEQVDQTQPDQRQVAPSGAIGALSGSPAGLVYRDFDRPEPAPRSAAVDRLAALRGEVDGAPAAGPDAESVGTAPGRLAALRAGADPVPRSVGGGSIIRRRNIVLKDGRSITTDDLKLKELRALQRFHPDDSNAIQAAIDAGEYRTTRARKLHNLSEGESDEENAIYDPRNRSYFRAVREEEEPEIEGLKPPVGFDPNISARAHVTAGTKAKKKSRFVSASHSMKVSGAWGAESSGKVAKFEVPWDLQEPGSTEFFDLMSDRGVSGTGLVGTGLNAAKASQEILVGGGVGPEYIQAMYEVGNMDVTDYQREGGSGATAEEKRFRTRTKTTKPPKPVKMTKVYDRDETSAALLGEAQEYWDATIEDLVNQTNLQFADTIDFTLVDEDDVAEFFTDQANVDSPYVLDYIQNDDAYDDYVAEMDTAARLFVNHMANTWRG